MPDSTDLTVTTDSPHSPDLDASLDTEDLTLDDLDQLDAVLDDDTLPEDDTGLELDDEVDPGGTPEVRTALPLQGGRS